MRLLLVHPSSLMYSEIFLRLEPLGLDGSRARPARALRVLGANLARGQANFARMLWRFNKVYNAGRQYADHQRPVRYELPLPPPRLGHRSELYIHSRAAAGTGSRRRG